VTCASCSGPSDNGTARCSWCSGVDALTARRDAAKPEHDHLLAQQHYAAMNQPRYDVGSGVSAVWAIRVCIGIFLLMLKLCVAASH
jgi:hypothetical protein